MRKLLQCFFLLSAIVPAVKAQDIFFYSVAASEHQYIDTPMDVATIIYNFNADTVHSFFLSWAIDGGAVTSVACNTVINPYSMATPLVHPEITTEGHHVLRIWTSLPDGLPDLVPANDTQTVQLIAYPYSAALHKKELLYEFTGAWCGYCSGGALLFQSWLNNDTDCIGASVHTTDVMSTSEGDAVYSNVNTMGSVPSISMDQYFFMPDGAALILLNPDPTAIPAYIAKRKHMASPVNVGLSNISYDSTAGTLSVDVTATTLHDLTDVDYRINLLLTEDSVTGGTDYDQNNYDFSHLNSSAWDTTTWLYPLGYTLTCNGQTDGWAHRHVVRFIANNTMGTANAIPANPTANATYTSHYTIPINAGWRKDYLTLIGTVEEYKNGTTVAQVLNAAAAPLMKQQDTDTVTIPPAAIAHTGRPGAPALSIWPNPAAGLLNIAISLQQAGNICLTILDAAGRTTGITANIKATAGINKLKLRTDNLPAGLYLLSTGNMTRVIPFTVVH